MKDKSEIVYSINIEDIQTVAVEEMGRELTDDEIDKVKYLIGEKIGWYDAILATLNEQLDWSDAKQTG
ncbi:MAG TPA: hypothetical protein VFR47_02575 [Anaerolineales bacterium]|nr:hypothetical protein [Anaerolineales bacterium]